MITLKISPTSFITALLGLCWSVSGISQSTKNLHPVVVTSKSGVVDSDTRRILVENFSAAMRESSLKTLGQQFYGIDKTAGFSGTGNPGPISSLRQMLLNMDEIMANRTRSIHRRLKPSVTDYAENDLEFYWTSRNFGDKILPINGNLVGMLFKIMSPTPNRDSKNRNPFAIQIGKQLAEMESTREGDIPGGISTLASEAPQAYEQLRDLNPGAWLPLYFKAGVGIDRNKKVRIDFSVSMIPVGFSLPKDSMDDISIESVLYQPSKDSSDVLNIRMHRIFDENGASAAPAVLLVNFGPLDPSTMGSRICTGDNCIAQVGKIPTISATMTGSWYKKAFASALSLNQFKMMISSLGINVKTLEVDTSSSELPVMVKTYTFGWKVLDTKRNVRPFNPLEAIQKSLIGDRVADGLTNVIQPASDKAEQSINKSVKAIIALFN